MDHKGVSTKPITLISGKSPFCETFFDDVEVPKENLIGDLNKGWTIAKKLLQHERKFISNFGLAAAMGSKKDVVSIAKKHFGELGVAQVLVTLWLVNFLTKVGMWQFQQDVKIFLKRFRINMKI